MIALVRVVGIMAAVLAAAAMFVVFCALVACLQSAKYSALERRRRRQRLPIAPDPIESYQPDTTRSVTTGPTVWIQMPPHLPIPLNPLGESSASMRERA